MVQPASQIACPAGQFNPGYVLNGGMMSPQPAAGYIPPVCESCPLLPVIDAVDTEMRLYGLVLLEVR